MRRPDVSGRLARLAVRSIREGCACTAHLWRLAVQRDLAGMTISAEVRSR